MSQEEREQILVGAVGIACADGEYEDEEGVLIGKVANALGISVERQLVRPVR